MQAAVEDTNYVLSGLNKVAALDIFWLLINEEQRDAKYTLLRVS